MSPPSDKPGPRPPGGDPIEKQLERVERLSEFGAQLAGALRTEFIYFWDRADRRAEVPESEAFVHRVNALRTLTARYLRETARCRHLPPVQTAHILRTLDLTELMEAGRGLENTARRLRERAREHGWSRGGVGGREGALPWTDPDGWQRLFSGLPVSREAPEEKKGGWLTGRLHSMVEKLTVTPVAPPQPQEAAPPPVPPGQRRLQAFESALELVVDLINETSVPIAALRAAAIDAGAMQRPLDKQPKVSAELRPLVPPAAQALQRDPNAKRMAAIAVGQWDRAAKLLEEFQAALENARKLPHEQVGEYLRNFHVEKLKGLIMPLTNLHITFRGQPALAALFPPPATRKIEANMPRHEVSKVTQADLEAAEHGPDAEEPPEEEEEEAPKLSASETSQRRLSLIMTYLTDPDSIPELSDETLVFRLVAEEHAYQEDRLIDLGMRIRLLPQPTTEHEAEQVEARREELLAALDEARQNKAHLQELMTMVRSNNQHEEESDEDA